MRKFPDFIEACANAVAQPRTPLIYRRWAALSAVAGALGRKVWYDQGEFKVRPNLFIFMVGPPTSGKSLALTVPFDYVYSYLCDPLDVGPELLAEARFRWQPYMPHLSAGLSLLKDSTTIQDLLATKSKIQHDTLMLPTNVEPEDRYDASLTLTTGELGFFLDKNDRKQQTALTEMWNAENTLSYRTKNAGKFLIKGPCLNWIAGCTLGQFVENMPANANEQGLLSRIIPVYFEGHMDSSSHLLKTDGVQPRHIEHLRHDLGQIAQICGPYRWDKAASEAAVAWLKAGQPPKIDNIMMVEYSGRRFSHLMKMCLSIAASKRDEKIILLQDWEAALNMLVEAEQSMPHIMRRFGMSDSGRLVDDLESFIIRRGGRVSLVSLKSEAVRISKSVSEVDHLLSMLVETGRATIRGEGSNVFYTVN